MADFTILPNAAVGVGGLPSGTTVTALRDNPLAIAEGASTAPRVLGSAIEYNKLVDFEVVTPALEYVFTDLPPFMSFAVKVNGNSRFTVSNNNGASWIFVHATSVPAGIVVFSQGSHIFVLRDNSAFEARIGAGPFNAFRVQNFTSGDLPAGRSWQLYSMARGLGA